MPSGPVSAWSHEDKIKETLLRSKSYLGPAIGQQIDALISPLNIGILVGTLILWAGAQFVGVGEVVDVILLVVGAAMIGPSIVNVVENLMEFGKCLVAETDADLDRSAKAFADAVVTGGITIIMAILLRKGAKAAEARVPGVARPSWLEVAKPKGAIGLPSVGPDPYAGKIWSRVSVTGTLTRPAGTGGTTMFGDIIYSLDGTATDRQLALLHERLHSALSPRFGILRTLRAQIKWASYSRSVLLKYLEEAMAECYAQLRVNGFKGALTGIKFPLGGRYVGVTVKGLAAEGTAIGTIAVGAQFQRLDYRRASDMGPESPASAPRPLAFHGSDPLASAEDDLRRRYRDWRSFGYDRSRQIAVCDRRRTIPRRASLAAHLGLEPRQNRRQP